MLPIQQNVSLKDFNTFGIDATASSFIEISHSSQLKELAQHPVWDQPKLVLGGGSNVLLLDHFDGVVIHMNNHGIERIDDTEQTAIVRVQAGENWHQFVLHAIEQGLGGVENLSLIPGSVGAAPMQNIGAYGVEIEEVFVELTAFHIQQKEFHRFTKSQCAFGYRTSVFKTTHRGEYIITDVTFQLRKQPKLNTSYGAIQQKLTEQGINNPTIKDVSDAVIDIRKSKLPNPQTIGNAGSFFKNPIVEKQTFRQLQSNYPDMPFYEVSDEEVKIPAGWLIEQCGLKGKRVGDTGTYKNQALIVVNYGEATGEEVWNFASTIRKTVYEKFGIELEPEVNLVGGTEKGNLL